MSARAVPLPLPAVDERLVASESGYEVVDGRIRYVAPADEPHGTRHSKLSALLEVHVGDDFEVACDMLTRLSEQDDQAPDASVFPRARDPLTGGRLIEQLAFEVASTETLSHAGKKAKKLIDRGVRRVFVLDVARQRALEWDTGLASWRPLDHDSSIEDPAFAVSLPLRALVSAAKVDDAIALALLRKRNPVLDAELLSSRSEGKLEGKAESLLAVLEGRGLAPSPEQRLRILTERSGAVLDRWLARVATCPSVEQLMA
jgi:hypothetical protein